MSNQCQTDQSILKPVPARLFLDDLEHATGKATYEPAANTATFWPQSGEVPSISKHRKASLALSGMADTIQIRELFPCPAGSLHYHALL